MALDCDWSREGPRLSPLACSRARGLKAAAATTAGAGRRLKPSHLNVRRHAT